MKESYDPSRPGHWEGLNSDGQLARYLAIAGEIEKLQKNSPQVLDVGCGAALLYEHLRWCTYVGIEPNSDAVAVARQNATTATVLHETAERFLPKSPFDAIVFNEVLYYAADPVGLLRKYAKHLTSDGIIIVSIFMRPEILRFRTKVRKFLSWRRPVSNIHCAELVEKEFESLASSVSTHRIQIGTSQYYSRLWVARVRNG